MRNIKLTIEYDGTHFKGWQIQAQNQRTVQGDISKALKKILKEKVSLTGSGRTDSGVHALAQVANFKTSSRIAISELQKALNANLKDDVSIIAIEEVSEEFHAQYSAKSKTYQYTISNQKIRPAQRRHFCFWYPYKLSLQKMREEAKAFLGRHDFKSFQATDPAKRGQKRDTVRTIKKLTISKKNDIIIIEIEANGFLYKMVRNIVGTLIEVGNEQLPKSSIKMILSQKNRTAAGITAKAHGLMLKSVAY